MRNKDCESILRSDCPVTGLPILSKPEWTDVSFGKNYKITVRVLGNCIILNQLSGHVSLHDAKKHWS